MSDIKYYMSLSVTVGVMLVGLLYCMCLAFQWIYGWPDKPGYKKYIEALKPWRIYSLTLATLDLLKYLQYGRLYFQLKSWYKDERNLKYYEKGITFGRRGNKLDLYHPPNLGKSEDMKSPVVVFIYGGAWSTGERSIYCLLGKQMAEELKATVICADYCTYPKASWREALDIPWTCLCSVYNTMDHHEHEQKRGIEYLSNMHRAMNGVANFPYYSPTHLLKKLSLDKVNSLPPFALLHGTNDIVVPVESTTRFSELLALRSVKVSLYLLPRASHTELSTDLMLSNRQLYHPIYRYIKQEFRKLLVSADWQSLEKLLHISNTY